MALEEGEYNFNLLTAILNLWILFTDITNYFSWSSLSIFRKIILNYFGVSCIYISLGPITKGLLNFFCWVISPLICHDPCTLHKYLIIWKSCNFFQTLWTDFGKERLTCEWGMLKCAVTLGLGVQGAMHAMCDGAIPGVYSVLFVHVIEIHNVNNCCHMKSTLKTLVATKSMEDG